MRVLLFAIFLLGAAVADEVCYDELGCFKDGYPFRDVQRPVNPLPKSREEVGTEFLLNTPWNNFDFECDIISNLQNWTLASSNFDPFLETKILAHGYGESGYSDWMEKMGRAFLEIGDYNIIRVNWFDGAFSLYPAAASNARIAGAEISLLMDKIKLLYPDKIAASASSYHIIGYSLGAHVAGYAGERQPGLARISGLDPAGPYFDNTAKKVRLDETDAVFVDVYHTDVTPLLERGYGMYEPCGHVDFYPNGGTDQPGCDPSVTDSLPLEGGGVYDDGIVFVACNHKRAHEIYIESITHPNDSPMAFQTEERNITYYYDLFDNPLPQSNQSMGIRAAYDPNIKDNSYFQRGTRPTTAFGYQYRVVIVFADPSIFADKAKGVLFLSIIGTKATISRVQLGDGGVYDPGSSHTFYIFTDEDPGQILEVGFYWEFDRDWYNLIATPDVYVDRIYLRLLEGHQSCAFCGDGDKCRANRDDDKIIKPC